MDDVTRELQRINASLDKIVEALERLAPKPAVTTEEQVMEQMVKEIEASGILRRFPNAEYWAHGEDGTVRLKDVPSLTPSPGTKTSS